LLHEESEIGGRIKFYNDISHNISLNTRKPRPLYPAESVYCNSMNTPQYMHCGLYTVSQKKQAKLFLL